MSPNMMHSYEIGARVQQMMMASLLHLASILPLVIKSSGPLLWMNFGYVTSIVQGLHQIY
jgi:hypothetical protein